MKYDPSISLLIVDDNPADLFFLKEVIEDDTNLQVRFYESTSVEGATKVLNEEEIDIVLLDLFLPDSSGIETFNKINELQSKASIIVLSGLNDEVIALETVRSGAQDFILKGEYNGRLLEKTIIYSFERKKNQELLASSNEKYRQLFQHSPLSLFIVEPETCRIEQSNIEASNLFGFSEKEFKNKKLQDIIIHSEDEDNQSIGIKKNRDEIYVRLNRQNMLIEDQKYELIQVEDITENVLFERNRMEVINSIQDAERRNFAMELHDGLAQELVLMNLYLEQLNSKIDNHSELGKIKEILNSSMIQSRRLTYNIAPPLLDDGFFEGLKVLFERFDKVNDAEIKLIINDDEDELCSDCIVTEIAYNAFRIIQEFLNNSIKHAEASVIEATIKNLNDEVVITIKDNGVGFENPNDKTNGMGISNMKNRAELFNLKLTISSEKDAGTSLELRIPQSQINLRKIAKNNDDE